MSGSQTERARVIRPGLTYVGKQGFNYGAGASAESKSDVIDAEVVDEGKS